MTTISFIAAFVAGILSFLSPCVLPIIPGYIAYLSGTAPKDAKGARWKIFLNSLFFVLGFSMVFALLGVLLNTVLEHVSYGVQEWLGRIGGLIIIVFGLFLLGLLKIPFLDQDHRIDTGKRYRYTYFGSFIFGAAFAVGWSPCVGALLGSVLSLAVAQPGTSFVLLLLYALGLGIPFLLAGVFASQVILFIQKFRVAFRYFNIVVGILLIILGILVFTQSLSAIANFSILNKWVLS